MVHNVPGCNFGNLYLTLGIMDWGQSGLIVLMLEKPNLFHLILEITLVAIGLYSNETPLKEESTFKMLALFYTSKLLWSPVSIVRS